MGRLLALGVALMLCISVALAIDASDKQDGASTQPKSLRGGNGLGRGQQQPDAAVAMDKAQGRTINLRTEGTMDDKERDDMMGGRSDADMDAMMKDWQRDASDMMKDWQKDAGDVMKDADDMMQQWSKDVEKMVQDGQDNVAKEADGVVKDANDMMQRWSRDVAKMVRAANDQNAVSSGSNVDSMGMSQGMPSTQDASQGPITSTPSITYSQLDEAVRQVLQGVNLHVFTFKELLQSLQTKLGVDVSPDATFIKQVAVQCVMEAAQREQQQAGGVDKDEDLREEEREQEGEGAKQDGGDGELKHHEDHHDNHEDRDDDEDHHEDHHEDHDDDDDDDDDDAHEEHHANHHEAKERHGKRGHHDDGEHERHHAVQHDHHEDHHADHHEDHHEDDREARHADHHEQVQHTQRAHPERAQRAPAAEEVPAVKPVLPLVVDAVQPQPAVVQQGSAEAAEAQRVAVFADEAQAADGPHEFPRHAVLHCLALLAAAVLSLVLLVMWAVRRRHTWRMRLEEQRRAEAASAEVAPLLSKPQAVQRASEQLDPELADITDPKSALLKAEYSPAKM